MPKVHISEVIMFSCNRKEQTQTTRANMQNSEEHDGFEANENNLWKTVQQPAKNAISYNMSSAKQRCYEDAICFEGPVQLELTVLVFHPDTQPRAALIHLLHQANC